MNIYHYDDNGVYRGMTKAQPDPEELGRWLVPRNATKIAPPATGDGEVAVFNGAAWSVVEDHRGTIIYNEDHLWGKVVSEIGPLPTGFVTVPPNSKYDQLINGEWVTDADQVKFANAAKAAAEVEAQLDRLAKNESRKSVGLPPLLDQESEEALKSHIKLVQAEADNPSADVAWNPPLPPGVTPPAIKSLAVIVKREPGWQGNLGFRATLKAATEDYVPTNIALAVYSASNCEGYQYTTGAFKQDAETGEYYAVCPPGFEPGDVDVHLGLLYGSAPLSCFTMSAGIREKVIYAYKQV